MDIEVMHDKNNHRFYIDLSGDTAYMDYRIHKGVMDIFRTFVPKEYEGQGKAASLMKEAVLFAQENKLAIVPSCRYAEIYLKRNPMI